LHDWVELSIPATDGMTDSFWQATAGSGGSGTKSRLWAYGRADAEQVFDAELVQFAVGMECRGTLP
jgi:hypothetical protein